MPGIHFHYQTDFKLAHPRLTTQWLQLVARKEKAGIKSLDYIFCSDQYLHQINKDYLKHNTYTDVITFSYGEPGNKKEVEGEVYVSTERISENSLLFKTTFDLELHRVIVHGALHLFGYNDKSASEKLQMRRKEEAYLSLR